MPEPRIAGALDKAVVALQRLTPAEGGLSGKRSRSYDLAHPGGPG